MDGFIEHPRELVHLRKLMGKVCTGGPGGRPGRAVLVRGHEGVGKSRLVKEFLAQEGLPHVYFTAGGRSREADLAGFVAEMGASTLPDADRLAGAAPPQSWDAALQQLVRILPTATPSAVVLDEVPYLVPEDPTFEGALQKHFDRGFSRLPTLLILIGSDVAMMKRINEGDRPFHLRGTELPVPLVNPAP